MFTGMLVSAVVFFISISSYAAPVTLHVTGQDLDTANSTPQPVTSFKWLLQEDNTYDSAGNRGVFNSVSSVSVSVHKSTAKVLATGQGANGTATFDPALTPSATGRYFVSVFPDGADYGGYTMTGGPYPNPAAPGSSSLDLVVYKNPLVAAQIKVLVFQDNNPVNGAPDVENPLKDFKIILYDQFGQVTQDVFGNPLGTTYVTANPDGTGPPVLDINGKPTVRTLGGSQGILSDTAVDAYGANVTISNLPPGKYGVRAVPTDGRPWVQTSTIEGTPGIDTWVTAYQPPYYTEAGFFGVHAFIGFILPTSYIQTLQLSDPYSVNQFAAPAAPGNVGSIAGQVVQNRINRPPLQMGLNPGEPVPSAWISLSESGTSLKQVFAMPCPGSVNTGQAAGSTCDANANFVIHGVPPGIYTLTMWDFPLDQIIDFRTVTVPPTASTTDAAITLGVPSATDPNGLKIPIFQWFGKYEGSFFADTNLNGRRDAGEIGLANLAVGLRFRDGTPYQATATDPNGNFEFPEVFPWFKWIIAESDYGRYYPTGATVYVDKGGAALFNINDNPANPASSLLEVRTDPPGPGTLLEGMLLYFDEKARIDWGRAAYPVTLPGTTTPIRNGGISGVISYAFTRAAADPSQATQSTWEPGIGNVTLNLYQVTGFDAVSGRPLFDSTRPVATTVSDSWDRFVFEEPNTKAGIVNKGLYPNTGLLTGCLDAMVNAGLSITPQGIPLNRYMDCAETISVWNQIKPAVFDGGYIFTEYTDPADGQVKPLPSGNYVVEVVPPAGYEFIKEEDQNFLTQGESYIPSSPQPAAVQAACVGRLPDGTLRTVPQFLADGVTPAPFAGQQRPMCNQKLVQLADAMNAAADFRLFTQVPLAGRLMGLVTDDLALEFRPGNPRLGDKPGTSFMPISIQDFNGHELVRTYTDEWGIFETLVPSTYTTNVPNPTGVSPHMVKILLNHPGFDPLHRDPWFNPNYPTAQWIIDIWAGKITYSDTPIIPIRPNIGANALDCSFPSGTPVIATVNGPAGGPWVENPAVANTVTITSLGTTTIPNPDPAVGGTLTKDYGFGTTQGTVTLSGVSLPIQSWNNGTIVVQVPSGSTSGQLMVFRGGNVPVGTRTGITLHVGVATANVRLVPGSYSTIQAAIDAASNGDLILIAPGTYAENLLMYKPVRLQGYGASSTVINGGYFTVEKQRIWNDRLSNATSGILTHPELVAPAAANKTYSNDPVNNPTPIFADDAGAAIMVLGRHDTAADLNPDLPSVFTNDDFTLSQASIDGLTVTGANLGSGIYVYGYAHNLRITNVKILSNQGLFGGGIRIGTPAEPIGTASFVSGHNDGIVLNYNEVTANGGIGLANSSGGGIGLFEGAENYLVTNSWICGNYSALGGAGIAHQGLSNAGSGAFGLIERNAIIFNEAFDEGAGIFITGESPALATGISEGAGNIVINANLIQGNKAGNLGGGIGVLRANGADVVSSPNTPANWYRVKIYNNMIVNNISAGFGGGIALLDSISTDIAWNTISNNNSTATGELAFGTIPFVEGPFALINQITTPMPAGIGVQPVSTALLNSMAVGRRTGYANFTSSPNIVNNIITGNFSYYWNNPSINQIATLSPYVYWDLGVFGSPASTLKPKNSVLTDPGLAPGVKVDQIAVDASNVTGDPMFASPYTNTISAFQGGATLGNFIAFSYSPMTLTGNYHVGLSSPAFQHATASPAGIAAADLQPGGLLTADYDIDPRPGTTPDTGADQISSKGDVNLDSRVDVLDALMALRLYLGLVTPPVSSQTLYNVHVAPLTLQGRPAAGSAVYNPPTTNTVTLADALLILQRAVGVLVW
jgi:large repetitive protein